MPMLDEELTILDFTLIKRKWCMYTQIELECAYSVHCTHIVEDEDTPYIVRWKTLLMNHHEHR